MLLVINKNTPVPRRDERLKARGATLVRRLIPQIKKRAMKARLREQPASLVSDAAKPY
jgi:hypothetical protein